MLFQSQPHVSDHLKKNGINNMLIVKCGSLPDNKESKAILAAIRVRNFVLSSRGTVRFCRLPSGHILFLCDGR